jgi:hypothetical protein
MRASLAFFLLAVPGFSQANPSEPRLRALGEALRAEILKNAPLLQVSEASSLLNRLSSDLDPATPPVNFEVVRSNQTEIFVLPGGLALVPARLLLATKSETELARHIAHAIAHIRLAHGIPQASHASTANLSKIPLIHIGGWDGIHRNPANHTALPPSFRAQQDRWEREANDYAANLLANRPPTILSSELTPELSRIQAQLLPLTISSKAPSLLR